MNFLGWFGLMNLPVALGQRGGDPFLDNLGLAGTGLMAVGPASAASERQEPPE